MRATRRVRRAGQGPVLRDVQLHRMAAEKVVHLARALKVARAGNAAAQVKPDREQRRVGMIVPARRRRGARPAALSHDGGGSAVGKV